MHPPHPLLANPCETPRSRAGNLPASNPIHSDVFLHRSEPDSSTLGATHCNTVYMCPQDLPTSKSTRIDAFLRVPNSILPRTGPPHVLASTPTRSDVFPLDFEPNRAVSTLAGPLSYYPDDESSSPSAPAESFRPETTSASPQGLLASKLIHSDPLRLDFKPNATISTLGPLSFHSDDEPPSPSAPAMSFRAETVSMHTRSLSAPETTRIMLFGGNHHHLASPNPTSTDPEPMALSRWPNAAVTMSKRDWKEKIDEAKHLLGVLKGKDRQEEELEPRIMSPDGNIPPPTSVSMPSDVPVCHSRPIPSVPGPTHRKPMFLGTQGSLASTLELAGDYKCVTDCFSSLVDPIELL